MPVNCVDLKTVLEYLRLSLAETATRVRSQADVAQWHEKGPFTVPGAEMVLLRPDTLRVLLQAVGDPGEVDCLAVTAAPALLHRGPPPELLAVGEVHREEAIPAVVGTGAAGAGIAKDWVFGVLE